MRAEVRSYNSCQDFARLMYKSCHILLRVNECLSLTAYHVVYVVSLVTAISCSLRIFHRTAIV